jgi:hypothetical protein
MNNPLMIGEKISPLILNAINPKKIDERDITLQFTREENSKEIKINDYYRQFKEDELSNFSKKEYLNANISFFIIFTINGIYNTNILSFYKFSNSKILIPDDNNRKEKNMDNDDILKTYIDKIDREQSDLRKNIQASEERTEHRIEKIEERMENRVNQMVNVVESKFTSLDSKFDSTKNWVIGISIAILLGVGGMVLSVLIAVLQKPHP